MHRAALALKRIATLVKTTFCRSCLTHGHIPHSHCRSKVDTSLQPMYMYTYEQRQALEDLGASCEWSLLNLPREVLDEFIERYKIGKARRSPKQSGLKAYCRFSTTVLDQGGCAKWTDVQQFKAAIKKGVPGLNSLVLLYVCNNACHVCTQEQIIYFFKHERARYLANA